MLDTSQVNTIIGSRPLFKPEVKKMQYQPGAFMGGLAADTLTLSKPKNKVISFTSKGKNINVVTFTGLKDPLKSEKPAIQMKVRGVMAHQYIDNAKWPAKDFNVNTLAGEKVTALEPDKKVEEYVNGRKVKKVIVGKKLVEKDDSLPRWKDGQKLNHTYKFDKRNGPQIVLSAPGIGEIGRVHDEVAEYLLPVLFADPENELNPRPRKDFQFELSNIVAGTTKGAETAGLRATLKYNGNDPKIEQHARESMDLILNDPLCADKVLLHQDKTSPEDVLKVILDYENKVNGPEAKKEMEEVIQNIVKELKNPANKRILLLGHCKPDGDTIGCVLGLKNALALMDPGRDVDCAIDDKIPGLFRHKMPGIDGEMKQPVNPERLAMVDQILNDLKARPKSNHTDKQIEMLAREKQDILDSLEMIKEMKQIRQQVAELQGKPGNEAKVQELNERLETLEHDTMLLDPDKKYDLVITMDVPTPKRFTNNFKNYFDNAKKAIYIDHHPHRIDEWQEAAPKTGLDMQKIHDNKLGWIADAVPAATQLVSVIANRLLPQLADVGNSNKKVDEVFNKPGQLDSLKAYVASLITGASTDTGSYTRTANLLPEHMVDPVTKEPVPVQKRPNFLPEGQSKWLMDLTGGAIDKKWLREEITWDISDEKVPELNESAREVMLKHAIGGKKVDEDLSLGIIQVDYDQMCEVWDAQLNADKDTTLLDIQNAYKYSEAMGVLRSDPALSGDNTAKQDQKDGFDDIQDPAERLRAEAKQNYEGAYDTDRIAILIAQDKKAGELDEKLNLAEGNGLRLSLRSVEGSIHAELLASLFGGGGHGGAAGGRVDLPGVQLDTPLVVKIDGKIENNYAKVLEALKRNYDIMHNTKIPALERRAQCQKVDVDKDSSGVPCADLIKNIVTEIRRDQPKDLPAEDRNPRMAKTHNRNQGRTEANSKGKGGKRRPHFTGTIQDLFNKKAV